MDNIKINEDFFGNIPPGDKYKLIIKDLEVVFKSKSHFLIECDYTDGTTLRISLKPLSYGQGRIDKI